METRLQELREELRRGEQQMAALDRERTELRDTMLRISGAIQVLEELLGPADGHRAGAGRTLESDRDPAPAAAAAG